MAVRPRARFAFLVHPLTEPLLRVAAARARRWRLLASGSADPDDAGPICRLFLEEPEGRVEGLVLMVPLPPARILEDQARALALMRAALGRAGGVDVVGLGSLLAVVAGRGAALQAHAWQPVTTGAAATAWTLARNARAAAEAVETWPRGPVAVLGYGGTVGEAVAAELRDAGAREIRVPATGAVARRAAADGLVPLEDAPTAVRGCRIVVGAHPAGAVLPVEALDPGAVVVEASIRSTVTGRVPPSIRILDGEAMAVPAGYRPDAWGRVYHRLAGYGPDHLFACVVEPLVMARAGATEPLSQGRRIDRDAPTRFGSLALDAGFRPVLARRGRAVDPADLASPSAWRSP